MERREREDIAKIRMELLELWKVVCLLGTEKLRRAFKPTKEEGEQQ